MGYSLKIFIKFKEREIQKHPTLNRVKFMMSDIQSKYAKKQKNMTCNQEKKILEADQEVKQMIELVHQNIKTISIILFHLYKERLKN